MSTRIPIFRCILLAGFLLSAAYSQVERGTISGIIRDPSGGVVPNAAVVVKNVNTGIGYRSPPARRAST